MLITDSQRVRDPIKWKQTAVMSNKWRLINGDELYDIQADPGQERNVIADHAAQAEKMRAFYDAWWTELEPTFSRTTEIYVGHPDHPMVSLTGHDWIQEPLPPWNQQHIRTADGYGPTKPKAGQRQKPAPAVLQESQRSNHEGHWAIKVVTSGNYQISLRRWPLEADTPITAELAAAVNVPGATQAYRARPGTAIPVSIAKLEVNGVVLETKAVQPDDKEIVFITRLDSGSHRLAPTFVDSDGNEVGAYYTIVDSLP